MKKARKKVVKLFLVFIMIVLTANVGCKKGEKEFDITDGSWGFFLQAGSASTGWVYQFVGSKQNGSVYCEGIKVGTYSAGNSIVDIWTQHHDPQNNVYVYEYTGLVVDYFKMNGTFSITPPGGPIVNGTWNATR